MIRKLITEILATFFLVHMIFVHAEHNCAYKLVEGLITADCSSRGMVIDVPQDLDYNIQFLNLSFNRLTYIDSHSFSRYTDLVRLEMQHMERVDPVTFDENSFLVLEKLEHIDVSSSCTNSSMFNWPPSLKVLKIEDCPVAMHLNNLPNLTELYAAHSGLASFPDFHRSAPVIFVDIRGAPLFSFIPEKVAPFCKLRRLILEVRPKHGIQEPEFYCNCLKAQAWFTVASIEAEPLNCTLPQKNTVCNETDDSEAMALRTACLGSKISNSTSAASSQVVTKNIQSMIYLLIGAIIFVGILAAVFMYTTRQITRKLSGDHAETEEEYDEGAEEAEEEHHEE